MLIGNEVDDLERYVHGELSAVTAVECSQSLLLVHRPCAVEVAAVGTVVHLHALLHSWWEGRGGEGGEEQGKLTQSM